MFVEGYTDQLSYRAGDTVRFHVSTSAQAYSLEVARIGAAREVVWHQDSLPGASHPVPEDASSHGCRWPVSHSLQVPTDWRSGYYEFVLRAEDHGGEFVRRGRRTAESRGFFIVRPSGSTKARILLQLATNTYAAYNNWGGYSLYAYHGRGGLQGHRVSFDRPMAGLFDRWERDFVEWVEAAGYALDYCANSDLEQYPELLDDYRLVLSVGHDEYWSGPMRDHLEGFIAAGGNAAFLSGNSVCWQVRAEDEARALVCWKQWFNMDPAWAAGDYANLSTLWSHHLVGRPESTLTGVGFLYGGYHLSHGQYMDGSGAFTVHRPEHWVLAGTGLQRGDSFGGGHTIVGYECDGCEYELKDGLPVPKGTHATPADFTILCTAPARWHPDDSEWYERWEKGREGAAVMGTLHPRRHGLHRRDDRLVPRPQGRSDRRAHHPQSPGPAEPVGPACLGGIGPGMAPSMGPALCWLLVLAAAPALARDGAITGRVEDGTAGAGLMGAHLQVAGTRLGAVADSSGHFTVGSVPPGTYRLTAKRLGYKARIVRQVVVRSGETTSVDIALRPQSIELATVTVVGQRPGPDPQQVQRPPDRGAPGGRDARRGRGSVPLAPHPAGGGGPGRLRQPVLRARRQPRPEPHRRRPGAGLQPVPPQAARRPGEHVQPGHGRQGGPAARRVPGPLRRPPGRGPGGGQPRGRPPAAALERRGQPDRHARLCRGPAAGVGPQRLVDRRHPTHLVRPALQPPRQPSQGHGPALLPRRAGQGGVRPGSGAEAPLQ